MLIDLHVGLSQRDGTPVDPQALVGAAKSVGLDGLVLAQTSSGSAVTFPDLSAVRSAAEPAGLSVFSALRLATPRGLLLAILPDPSKPLGEEWVPGDSGLFDADKVLDAVEDLGGVVIALRPYDREVPKPMGDHIFSLPGIHACETQSGRLGVQANGLALEAATNLELPCVGSSSADGTDGLGTAATLFRGAVHSEADLVEAIRNGDVWPVAISTRLPRVEGGDGERRGNGGGEPRRSEGGEPRRVEGEARPRREDGGGRRRGRRGGRGRGSGRDGARADAAPREDRQPVGDAQPRPPRAETAPRSEGERGPRSEGDRGRRRGGRGRGRSGGGGGGDDVGNRIGGQPRRPLDEDAGNRIPSAAREVDDNIGNRLRPGQESAFHRFREKLDTPPAFVPPPDDDDNIGNR